MRKLISSGELGAAKQRALVSLVIAALTMIVAAAAFSWMFQAYVLARAEENVTNLLLSHKGIHHYVQNTLIPAYTMYQDERKIPATFYAPELLSSSFIVRNQHAFYNQERQNAGYPELYYKLAANNPRNPVNKADALEQKLIKMFNEKRDVKSYREIVEIDGAKVLYVAIPFLENGARCLRCHGKREDAPPELQQRYPGQGGFNEKIDEIRAITSIRAPLEHEYRYIYVIGLTIFVGFMAFGTLFFFNTRLRSLVSKRTTLLESEVEQRKRTEEILRQNRSTLKQILDTTPQAIFWKDCNGVYLGCNRFFAKSVGVDEPELIKGKTDFDLPWPKHEAEAYRADDQEVLKTNQPKLHIVEPLQLADGSRRWIDTSKVPLINGDGEVYGVLGVFEDITEQRRKEAEKKELEKRLQQAHKMEAVGTMAGGIAHDFNNILSIVLGYAEMVKDDMDPQAKSIEDIEKVLDAGNRAKELVKQILAFSRQEKIQRIALQLQALIKETLKMLRSSIPTTIEIQDEIDSNCGVVCADPTQVHQILMNLCTNAYQAMEATGGILKIQLKKVYLGEDRQITPGMKAGEYVELVVSDTGSGIGPDVIDKIFNPYFTTKEQGKGTGMGLAISHGIIVSYGGGITVESKLGEGTTFHVYFPVVAEQELPLAGHKEQIQLGSEHILFVDDEDILATMGKGMLERLGYRVTVRQSSLEALAIFQNDPEAFDVIITDQTMPGMTGSDLARRILQIRPGMPIILCTGYSNLIDEDSAKALGIKEFALKPLTKGVIAKLIRKVLDEKPDT
nr:DUF3365 domain-containing protein [Desulfobulbaceae bacterium]